ncbi:unnamed protein product [Gordionus sp. m RMFG-2023]
MNLYDSDTDTLYVSECVCLLSRNPIAGAYKKILNLIFDIVSLQKSDKREDTQRVNVTQNSPNLNAETNLLHRHSNKNDTLPIITLTRPTQVDHNDLLNTAKDSAPCSMTSNGDAEEEENLIYQPSAQNYKSTILEKVCSEILCRISFPHPGTYNILKIFPELLGEQYAIEYYNPGHQELPFFDYDIVQALSIFDIKMFLNIFTCLLIEKQILICSKSPEELANFCETLKALLYPFIWNHVYVPLLPSSLHHFIEAPVPFLMGYLFSTVSDENAGFVDKIKLMPNLCLANLDTGFVKFPDNDDNTLPEFPDQRIFAKELFPFLRCGQGLVKNKLVSNTIIRTIFALRFARIFRNSESFFVEKHGTFDCQAFICDQNPSFAPFLAAFLDTQAFTGLHRTSGESDEWHLSFFQTLTRQCIEDSNFEQEDGVCPINHIDEKGSKEGNGEIMQEGVFASTLRDCNINENVLKNAVIYTEHMLAERYKPENQKIIDLRVPQTVADISDEFPFDFSNIRSDIFIYSANDIDEHPNTLSKAHGKEGPLKKLHDNFNGHTHQYFKLNTATSPAEIAHTNWKFVEALLKESKFRTKRMLVDKLTKENKTSENRDLVGKDLGTLNAICDEDPKSITSEMNVAENTLTGNLCDMLERIWNHGFIKQQEVKSALWHNMMTFVKDRNPPRDSNRRDLLSCPNLTFSPPLSATPILNLNIPDSILGCTDSTSNNESDGRFESLDLEDNLLGGAKAIIRNRINSLNISSLSNLKSTLNSKLTSTPFSPPFKAITGAKNNRDHRESDKESLADNKANFLDLFVSKSQDILSKSIWPKQIYIRNVKDSILYRNWQLPNSIEFDLSNIQTRVKDIQSQIGLVRCFIKLALERKSLHSHLNALIYDAPHADQYLRKNYKRYAFLRSDEEKEQFLFHVLSLKAVDYYSFTNTFVNTIITYRLLFFPTKPVNFYRTLNLPNLVLVGSLRRTPVIHVPNNSLEYDFQHQNLGILSAIRLMAKEENLISNDEIVDSNLAKNKGHYNDILKISKILVRNEITGRIYKFVNNFVGSGMYSIQNDLFFYFSQVLPYDVNLIKDKADHLNNIRRNENLGLPNSHKLEINIGETSDSIKASLVSCVNALHASIIALNGNYDMNGNDNKASSQIVIYLCGNDGLISGIENVFLYGKRSHSKFFKPMEHIWSFIGKINEYFTKLNAFHSEGWDTCTKHNVSRILNMYAKMEKGSTVINRRDKHTKFTAFICQLFKQHLLHHYIRLIAQTPLSVSVYTENSFFRDQNSLKFIHGLFEKFEDIELESITFLDFF